MIFSSRKDSVYLGVIGLVSLIAFLTLILPIILGSTENIISPIISFIVIDGVLLWFIFSMKYTLLENELLVKSAFFKKRIQYADITGVRQFSGIGEMLTGYQLLTSKDGIEISYNSGVVGSVKISPDEQNSFLIELQNRCPGIRIESSIKA